MLFLGVALAAVCCAVCVIVVAWAGRERHETEDAGRVVDEPVRAEDLVRPVVDAAGRLTWVPADDIVWHEIVDSSRARTVGRDKRRRTA